jgi:hypothetical protein
VLRLASALVLSASLVAGCSLVLPNDGLSGGAVADGGAGASSLPSPNLIDCGDAAFAGDLRCRAIGTLTVGSVGAGPAFDWNGVPRQEIVGGFAEPGRLVLAVRPSTASEVGGLLAIDLVTGDRTLIAGSLRTPDHTFLTHGQGWGFQGVTNVVPSGPLLQAHTVDEFGFGGFLIDVDPVTGDRTDARSVGGQCEQVLPPDFFPLKWRSPALAPDTAIYLVGDSIQGQGIVRQLGEGCELLVPLAAGEPGFDPNFLVWHQAKLWSVDPFGKELSTIDLVSGSVETVSDAGDVPFGTELPLGIHHLAVRDDRVFTVGGDFQHRITEVVRSTGMRVAHAAKVGPLQTPFVSAPRVYMHPTLAALLVVFDGAVVVYDPATDRANTLSY